MLVIFQLLASGFAFFMADEWWHKKHYTWAGIMAILGLLNIAMAVSLL